MTVRAIQAKVDGSPGFQLVDVEPPQARPDEVVVRVAHVSANYGELRYAEMISPGRTLGFDAAGYVAQAASDGSGPPVGARVAAVGPGAWSELAVFSTADVALVPATVDLASAAALPMVGITALRNLRDMGSVLGKRLLVTGASGGVGRCAIQLGRMSGASVVAVSGSLDSHDGLYRLGAEQVVAQVDETVGEFDGVFETVGGPTLLSAWAKLAPHGRLMSIGWASNEPVSLETNALFTAGGSRSIHSSGELSNAGRDLELLIALVDRGLLSPEIGWRGDWSDIATAAEELLGRRVPGKVILDVGR